jgi:hypothetical protein
MDFILPEGEESSSLPSSLSDPFKKNCIESVSLYSQRSLWDYDDIKFAGSIHFKSGMTKGTQSFEAKDFTSLVKQMQQFVANL